MASSGCKTCAWENSNGKEIDDTRTNVEWGELIGASEASIRRHRAHSEDTSDVEREEFQKDSEGNVKSAARMAATAWTEADWRSWLKEAGTDPDTVTFTFGVTSNPAGGYWNKLLNVKKKVSEEADESGPAWPVVQRAKPVAFAVEGVPSTPNPRGEGLSLRLKCADPQIGFRAVGTGYEEFHDRQAMRVFTQVCKVEQPDEIAILGDVIDLPSQSRWAQEAGFARTTQMALDETHEWLAELRAVAPSARIIMIEGNHDKRMQAFIEANALAAFGIKRANMPKSWPVMSLPYLLRLEEIGVEYQDAYPTATHWDDDRTRNIHGTRANSKGSTMSQYAQELPHINTWAGHTHRAEIVYKTVLGPRGEAIESYSANPGCLCKTDGTVPSVHGATHADGSSAKVVEDWQQGFGSLLLNEITGESWPQVHRIKDGKTLYNGRLYG